MTKPVCYMGTYNEHDIRDMHTVVVRYVTDFKSNPDRVIPLYEHPPNPTTERRAIPEDVRKVLEMALSELEADGVYGLDHVAIALRNALNAAPAPTVPDGWKLVPIEPTEKMLAITKTERVMENGGTEEWQLEYWAYQRMLNAAPAPTRGEV